MKIPKDPILYRIKDISDFLKVPSKRRKRCLKEFVQWMEMYEDLNEETSDIPSDKFRLRATFLWVDDGKLDHFLAMNVVKNKESR